MGNKKNKPDVRKPERRWPAVVVAALLVALFGLLLSYHYGGRATSSDYEGTIVDRWADYTHSEYDPKPYFRLLVEASDGKRFTVRVDPNVYESARVGMKIKSRSGQVVLIENANKSNSQ